MSRPDESVGSPAWMASSLTYHAAPGSTPPATFLSSPPSFQTGAASPPRSSAPNPDGFGGPSSHGLPPGVVPNYVDPVTRANEYLVPGILFCVLAMIFVALRLGVKRRIVKRMTWDDALIGIACVFAIAQTIVNVVLVVEFKMGRHIWDIPLRIVLGDNKNLSKDLTFVASMLYLLGIMCAKVSLLMLYLSIFSVRRWFRWLCYGMMAFVATYCLTFFVMYATYCNPPAMVWQSIGWTKPGKCLDVPKMYWANGALNIGTDVILLIMPLPMVWGLQMNTRKKLGVVVSFATGIFTVLAAVLREIMVVSTLHGIDQTWIYIPTVLWLSIELDVGIIATCLPTLRPLHQEGALRKLVPSSARALVSCFKAQRIHSAKQPVHQGYASDSSLVPKYQPFHEKPMPLVTHHPSADDAECIGTQLQPLSMASSLPPCSRCGRDRNRHRDHNAIRTYPKPNGSNHHGRHEAKSQTQVLTKDRRWEYV